MEEPFMISADQLFELSQKLASIILKSGFQPDFLIGIWRGGAPVGIAVQEFFKYFKVKTDHIAIRTISYIGTTQQKEISVDGLEYIIEKANSYNSILLIDDIFDSGRSIEAILKTLQLKMRNNLPSVIKVATVFYKPENNKTLIKPDFYVESTNKWVIFPHELEGLSLEQIRQYKGEKIYNLIKDTQEEIEKNRKK